MTDVVESVPPWEEYTDEILAKIAHPIYAADRYGRTSIVDDFSHRGIAVGSLELRNLLSSAWIAGLEYSLHLIEEVK